VQRIHIPNSVPMIAVREYSIDDNEIVFIGNRKSRSNVVPKVIPIGAVARMSMRHSKNTIFDK